VECIAGATLSGSVLDEAVADSLAGNAIKPIICFDA
jgi:hypothetical protein